MITNDTHLKSMIIFITVKKHRLKRIDASFSSLNSQCLPYYFAYCCCCSVTVMSNSLWPHRLAASLSLAISWNLLKLMSIESVMPSNHLILCHHLLLLPSVFVSIRVFPLSWLFTSGGHSIGASSLAWDLPMNIQGWFPLGFTSLISLLSKGISRVLSQYHTLKASILWRSAFFMVQLSHLYMTTGKTMSLTIRTFFDKVMSLLFNMLSRLVIVFLLRSKCLLILWLQSPSAVILEAKKIKSVTVSIVSPSICHEVMGSDATILVFECWVLSQLFHSPLPPSSRGSLVLQLRHWET